MTPKPTILVVDDHIEDGKSLATLLADEVTVFVREPSDIVIDDLREADLVLVDYELTDWTDVGTNLTVPPNGLALAGVLRQQIDELGVVDAKGVALYSGKIENISANLPEEVRGYALARLNNLEWVFEKGGATAGDGIVSLASAMAELSGSWPEGIEAIGALHTLLALESSAPFFATAAEDVAACHPPIHELSAATHALVVVRWLAQRILPYPAFLMDRWALAARLRIDPGQLDAALKDTDLGDELATVTYQGALCDLLGSHWWRAGVDDLIFGWTNGAGGNAEIRSEVEKRVGDIAILDGDLVAVIDDSYRPATVAKVDESVRLRPDDWPVFADEARATIGTASGSERLRGLVVPGDQGMLK